MKMLTWTFTSNMKTIEITAWSLEEATKKAVRRLKTNNILFTQMQLK